MLFRAFESVICPPALPLILNPYAFDDVEALDRAVDVSTLKPLVSWKLNPAPNPPEEPLPLLAEAEQLV